MNKKNEKTSPSGKRTKPLQLNRETIHRLDPSKLPVVLGGFPSDGCSFKPGTFGCCQWN